MKYLTILFILPVFCFGQNHKGAVDSITFRVMPGKLYYDSVFKKLDTIPVLLLVSDTSNEFIPTGLILGNGAILVYDSVRYGYNTSVFWKRGYSVRKLHPAWVGEDDGNGGWGIPVKDYYTHLYYLDEHLKPLSKNFVVWQSINLK